MQQRLNGLLPDVINESDSGQFAREINVLSQVPANEADNLSRERSMQHPYR